jgi:hypothetical protein
VRHVKRSGLLSKGDLERMPPLDPSLTHSDRTDCSTDDTLQNSSVTSSLTVGNSIAYAVLRGLLIGPSWNRMARDGVLIV